MTHLNTSNLKQFIEIMIYFPWSVLLQTVMVKELPTCPTHPSVSLERDYCNESPFPCSLDKNQADHLFTWFNTRSLEMVSCTCPHLLIWTKCPLTWLNQTVVWLFPFLWCRITLLHPHPRTFPAQLWHHDINPHFSPTPCSFRLGI